jgi:hypothetical protein
VNSTEGREAEPRTKKGRATSHPRRVKAQASNPPIFLVAVKEDSMRPDFLLFTITYRSGCNNKTTHTHTRERSLEMMGAEEHQVNPHASQTKTETQDYR